VLISHETSGETDALHLIPRAVTAGIGCKKSVGTEAVEAAFEAALQKAGCHALAVCGVCSLDLKADEPGLLAFCGRRGLPFRTFAASELAGVGGDFHASTFVKNVTGTDNVCERAAVLGSGGRLLAGKEALNGVTVALAINEPKLRFEEDA
jgi:cobalt-precorrin 5A hydrolase